MIIKTETTRKIIGFFLFLFVFFFLQTRDLYAEEISKEFRGDITMLLKMTGAEALGLQMGTVVMNQMIESLSKKNPEMPQRAVAIIKEELNLIFAEEMSKLIAETVPLYAKYFSHDEVKGLIVFYGTPLGKKSIQVMPALMNECMKVGQDWGQRIIPNLMPRLESRLKREGFSGL